MSQEWYEKYAPKTLADYVFGGEEHLNYVASCLQAQHVRPVVLWGTYGVGKSSLLEPLLHECGVDKANIWRAFKTEAGLDITAALKNLEQKAKNTEPALWGNMYIILDEFDRLTAAQANKVQQLFDMYSAATWLFTTNNIDKISDAMKSRCAIVHVGNPDKDQLRSRLEFILEQEGIAFSSADLDSHIAGAYPSIRNIIKNLQTRSAAKTLRPFVPGGISDKDRREQERLSRVKANTGALLQETKFNKFELIIPTYLKRKLKETLGFQFRQTVHGYSSVVESEGQELDEPTLQPYLKSEVLIVSYTDPKQLEHEKRQAPDFKELLDAEINNLAQADRYKEHRKRLNSIRGKYANKPEELKSALAEFFDSEFGLFSIDYKIDTGTVNGVRTGTDWINLVGARKNHPKAFETLDLVGRLAFAKIRSDFAKNLAISGARGHITKEEFQAALEELKVAASLLIEEAFEYDARVTGEKYGTEDLTTEELWERFNK